MQHSEQPVFKKTDEAAHRVGLTVAGLSLTPGEAQLLVLRCSEGDDQRAGQAAAGQA